MNRFHVLVLHVVVVLLSLGCVYSPVSEAGINVSRLGGNQQGDAPDPSSGQDQKKQDEDNRNGNNSDPKQQNEEGDGDQQTNENETPSLEDLIKKLTSTERPRRLEAARNLVGTNSSAHIDAVCRLLVEGDDTQKNALLTVLAGYSPKRQKQVNHLLVPLLKYASQTSEKDASDLREAIFYYPYENVFREIESLLSKKGLNGNLSENKLMMRKSRLIRLMGRPNNQISPKSACRVLLEQTSVLDSRLYPEIVSTLQRLFFLYDISSLESWKKWWEKNQDKSSEELFRGIAEQLAGDSYSEWRKHLPQLLNNQETSRVKIYAEQLSSNDSRKLKYLCEYIRKNPPDDRGKLSEVIVSLLAADRLPGVRVQALETIGKLDLKEIRDRVVPHLSDFRPEIRKSAASALGVIGDNVSGRHLLERFKEEENPAVVVELVQSLKELNYREAVDELTERLLMENGEGKRVESTIVSALGVFRGDESIQALKRFLKKTDPAEDRSLRFDIAYSMGQLQAPELASSLIELTRDPHSDVRMSAAQALGNIDFGKKADRDIQKQAVDRLFELVLDTSRETTVRSRAADSIGSIGTPESLDRLLGILEKQDSPVQNSVRQSIKSLLLEHYPDRLIEMVEKLQEKDYHSFAVSIYDGYNSREEGRIEKEPLLKFKIAGSHAELGNHSDVIKLLTKLEEHLKAEATQIQLMRVDAFLNLGNFDEAIAQMDTLSSSLKENSENWWRLQVYRARLPLSSGNPEEAIQIVNKLREQGAVPETINNRLTEVVSSAKSMIEQTESSIDKFLSTESRDEREKIKSTLLEDRNSNPFVGKKVLDRLKQVYREKQSGVSLLSDLMADITGISHSLSSSTEKKKAEEAFSDWEDWLKKQEQ